MSNTNTDGPAFPVFDIDVGAVQQGMTLRDYTAIKVLSGFAANPAIFAENPRFGWGLVNCTEEQLSNVALQVADAFLKAREA